MPKSSPKEKRKMSDNEFIMAVKKIVGVGDKNTRKVCKRLVVELGFMEVNGGNGHHHLVHARLRGYKATVSSSPSCAWGPAFVSNIRHAMWNVNGR